MNIGMAFERLMDILTPQEFKKDLQTQKKIRMFIYSHAFGPFVGLTIPLTLLFIDPNPWPHVPILALSIVAFWPFLVLLRMFPGAYVQLSLISVCNDAFAILWGCYHYGGASSPFLAWLVLIPLLTFLYIGSNKVSRVFVLALSVGGLGALYLLYRLEGFPELVDPHDMVLPGLASGMGVIIYTYMMSLYYTNVVDNRSELVREIERHKSTMAALVHAKDVAEDAQRLAESERTTAQQAQVEAERANAAKTLFLARMSHELRTPLNAVLGYSELLLEDTSRIRPADEIQDLKRIGAAGKHLLAMVNDVLDISRIEAGKAHVYSDPVDLDRLLEDLSGTMMPAMRDNNNRFVLHAEGRLGTIMGDGTKIRQAIINLVANAAKFTRDGIVTLKARRYVMEEESWLDIAVSDTGIGISPEEQKKLFTNFTQANSSVAVNYGGSGLGLSLSQNLCRLMGGSISLHSVPGHGSTFTIHLPMNEAAVDEVHPETAPVIFEPEGRKPFNATAHRIVTDHSPKPEYDAMVEEAVADLHEKIDGFHELSSHLREHSERPRVMVCDVDRQYLARVERDLRRVGYAPLATGDASSVLRLARASTPRAVLISDRMVASTQIKLLQIFSSDPLLYNIPVIKISATRPDQGIQNPVSGYLPFSASEQELKDKLTQVISDSPNVGYLIRANSR